MNFFINLLMHSLIHKMGLSHGAGLVKTETIFPRQKGELYTVHAGR